jgi:RNA polymerase sigma-70 factor (ECF subfamily)
MPEAQPLVKSLALKCPNLKPMRCEPFAAVLRTDDEAQSTPDGASMNPASPESDETLMARAMRGQSAPLATLVDRYYGPILGYLFRLVGGQRQVAEDLAQETFLRLMQQGTYQPGRSFRPWIFAIATNLARDQLRATARHATEAEDALEAVEDDAPGPEALALAAEAGHAVAAAFARLGAEYRAALLLRFYHGLSLHEIAEALAIPLGTVKSRLSVGTRRLRDLLQPIYEGASK